MSDELSTRGSVLDGLEWRLIGPHRGGRVVAVAGDVSDPMTFYFGACAGGVWKTTDGGTTWQNVSDGYFGTAAVGALAVSPADPNVLYAGTGEATIRNDVSHGDGVYRSLDGGKTWANVGLRDTRHIAKIRVHPQDPELVYVAALGHAWGPNEERGVFRSRDGGRTWDKVLYTSERAGAIDLALDPHNPRILYASLWQAQRYPHALVSGGPESGLWRSTDGGDTWEELTRKPGLPQGALGKIGVAVSPARRDRVWAIVEAEDGAVFRSDDGGETWQRLSEEKYLRTRAWYYMHIFADPRDEHTVWVLNFQAWRSIDGGRTFATVPSPHGDEHDLWLDPTDPRRMIKGNDGGAAVSFNGGASWSSLYNQPTAQLYHVTTDDRFPYRVYGSQQDNTAIGLPSATVHGIIHQRDWVEPGGGESGYIAVKPDDPELVVASGPIGVRAFNDRLLLYNGRTGQRRNITIWPELLGWSQGAEAMRYRLGWTYPIHFSRHDPDVLYVAGNRLFRSTDLGTSWEVLSDDLTRNDPSKLGSSGGPITRDNTGAEVYCTIFALADSPQRPDRLWAGTDDGLVHRSEDGGRTWEAITPPDLPEWALISIVEPSPHDADTLYLAATRYKLDDPAPYLYRTTDAGRSWTRIVDGIPPHDFTRAIRADPQAPGLLYAGTETGLYVSFDDGANWQRLGGNLPVVPIHDLVVKGSDLVVATHGRSFWILDDLTPLRELAADSADGGEAAVRLFPPRPTVRMRVAGGWAREAGPGQHGYAGSSTAIVSFLEERRPDGTTVRRYDDAGENPPAGAIVYYSLRERPETPLTLRVLDAAGTEVRSFTGTGSAGDGAGEGAEEEGKTGPVLPARSGLNRFVWDLRHAGTIAVEAPDLETWERPAGPLALPGRYTVELRAGDQTLTQDFEVVPDPRVEAGAEELRAQFELLMAIRDRLSATNALVNQIRALYRQLAPWEERFPEGPGDGPGAAVGAAARALREGLGEVERALIDTRSKSPLLFPYGLHEKLNGLFDAVDSADYAPPENARAVFTELSARLDEQTARFRSVVAERIGALDEAIRAAGLPPLGLVE